MSEVVRAHRHRAAGALVLLISLSWGGSTPRTADGFVWLFAALVAAAGLALAIGLWRGQWWARETYWVWAAATLGLFVFRETQVEPVTWKVLVAGGRGSSVSSLRDYCSSIADSEGGRSLPAAHLRAFIQF